MSVHLGSAVEYMEGQHTAPAVGAASDWDGVAETSIEVTHPSGKAEKDLKHEMF